MEVARLAPQGDGPVAGVWAHSYHAPPGEPWSPSRLRRPGLAAPPEYGRVITWLVVEVELQALRGRLDERDHLPAVVVVDDGQEAHGVLRGHLEDEPHIVHVPDVADPTLCISAEGPGLLVGVLGPVPLEPAELRQSPQHVRALPRWRLACLLPSSLSISFSVSVSFSATLVCIIILSFEGK